MPLDVASLSSVLDTSDEFEHPPIDTTPVIVLPAGARSSRVEELQNSLPQLDNQLRAWIEQEQRIILFRNNLQLRVANIRNAMAPISGLPTETLRQIFKLVLDPQSPLGDSIRLSQVCSRWRTIAIDQRELWTTLAVPRLEAHGMLDEFARRSAPLRLRIIVQSSPYTSPRSLTFDPSYKSRISQLHFGSEDSLEHMDSMYPTTSLNNGKMIFSLSGFEPSIYRPNEFSLKPLSITSLSMEDGIMKGFDSSLSLIDPSNLQELILWNMFGAKDRGFHCALSMASAGARLSSLMYLEIGNCANLVWSTLLASPDLKNLRTVSLRIGSEEDDPFDDGAEHALTPFLRNNNYLEKLKIVMPHEWLPELCAAFARKPNGRLPVPFLRVLSLQPLAEQGYSDTLVHVRQPLLHVIDERWRHPGEVLRLQHLGLTTALIDGWKDGWGSDEDEDEEMFSKRSTWKWLCQRVPSIEQLRDSEVEY